MPVSASSTQTSPACASIEQTYLAKTTPRARVADAFIVFTAAVLVGLLAYAALCTAAPLSSFLAALFSCLGTLVLTGRRTPSHAQ